MKKLGMIWVVTLLVMASAAAQEYKFSKTGGRLNINIPVAVIEGINGNEVVISVTNPPENTDERSKGLRTLVEDGLQDNSGLGINVNTKGNETDLNMINQYTDLGNVTVKIPKGITVSLNSAKTGNTWLPIHGLPFKVGALEKSIQDAVMSAQNSYIIAQGKQHPVPDTLAKKLKVDSILKVRIKAPQFKKQEDMNEDAIIFRNMDNPLEVSVQYNSLKLENITGPATIKTVYGDVEATFSRVKSPVSMVTVYGFVDVTLPEATRANVDFSTAMGELLVDPEFKFEADKSTAEGSKNSGTSHDAMKGNWDGPMAGIPFWGDAQQRFKGKMNGGGGDSISLKTTYGKIYVRKK